MPATSRGKIYNSLQLGNLFHLFSHKGLWSGPGNYRDNCLSKASRLAGDQSVSPEQKTRKAFLRSLNNASELTHRFCTMRKLHVSISSPTLSDTALHLSLSVYSSLLTHKKNTHMFPQTSRKKSIQ